MEYFLCGVLMGNQVIVKTLWTKANEAKLQTREAQHLYITVLKYETRTINHLCVINIFVGVLCFAVIKALTFRHK
jgi:hypothetical protein